MNEGATNFRKEHGDGWGNKKGSYGLHDKDGRMRVVHYVADKHGFRAVIKTNEPGTGNADAANAVFNGPDAHKEHTHVVSGSHGHHHGDHWGKHEDHWGKHDKHDKHEDHWGKHDNHHHHHHSKHEDHWNKHHHGDHWGKQDH